MARYSKSATGKRAPQMTMCLSAYPLSDSKVGRLKSDRRKGKSDSQIFRDAHPPKPRIRRTISLEDLTLHQIALIAQELLNEELSTLKRMAKNDLIALVRRIATLKGAQIGFDIETSEVG